MALRFRHRHAIALPFVTLALVALVGGAVNSVDARARIIDDLTDKGVKDARITHGSRIATTDANGEFLLPNVPRTSKYQIDAQGYLRTSAPTTAEEVRLSSLSVTIYAFDETKDRLTGPVKNPQARDPANTKILAVGNESGQIIVAPHPGRNAKVLLCGEGFEPKEVTVEGVLMEVGLKAGGTGCPPLPSPSPAPGATPSPTGPPSPSPSPTGSP
jgi:hypothetical protein